MQEEDATTGQQSRKQASRKKTSSEEKRDEKLFRSKSRREKQETETAETVLCAATSDAPLFPGFSFLSLSFLLVVPQSLSPAILFASPPCTRLRRGVRLLDFLFPLFPSTMPTLPQALLLPSFRPPCSIRKCALAFFQQINSTGREISRVTSGVSHPSTSCCFVYQTPLAVLLLEVPVVALPAAP